MKREVLLVRRRLLVWPGIDPEIDRKPRVAAGAHSSREAGIKLIRARHHSYDPATVMATREDYKQAAIDQWTADPCGSNEVAATPGTREYFEDLLAVRADYAPWMADALDYRGAAGCDVLDVGCGQGIDVAHYAMAGATSTGIDLPQRHA